MGAAKCLSYGGGIVHHRRVVGFHAVSSGINAGQEVPHLHVHIFAGRPLGPMLAR